MIYIYKYLTLILSPFIDLYFGIRRKKGKEDAKRFPERLGKPSLPRPTKPVIWVHCASVGEVFSVIPLVKKIKDNYENIAVLITTGTVSSANLLKNKLPAGCFHQYAPIDKLIAVQRFLAYWKPSLALWVESEIWPNMLAETKKTGCKIIQVNARISENSYKKWLSLKKVINKLLANFSLSLVQSATDEKRFIALGAENVKMLGNLKFDSPLLPASPKKTGELVQVIKDRPVFLCASTHRGEEEFIVETHRILKQSFPNLLTIIAPRHPDRAGEIIEEFSSKLNFARRSLQENIEDKTDIYLADTMGELGIFYRIASIVFMGGSLIPHGGQNPIEPARLECVVIVGKHTHNFKQIYGEMEEGGLLNRINDAEELAEQVKFFLDNPTSLDAMALQVMQLVKEKTGVIDKYLHEIEPYLKPLADLEKEETNN